MASADVGRTVQAVWKLESARIIAGLTKLVHDVGRAEEFAQDALVAALEQWPRSGVPDNPAAWLMTTARRRAIDDIRRATRFAEIAETSVALSAPPSADADPGGLEEPTGDDVLRLVLLTCHPLLPATERVALTLRLVAGLTATEIARAFLTNEAQINQRIGTAKKRLADAGVALDEPVVEERLASVLGVLYLIFNEGYSATAGDELIRADLCREALRLGRMLAELVPTEPEVHGLVALMEIQASRTAARTDTSGQPIRLEEQNRALWDPLLIRRGFTAMLRARDLGRPPGPYVLQAAIAVTHAQARRASDTDWAQIASLYDALVVLLPTPVVRLNRAVAVGRACGSAAGLALVDELADDASLRDYHLLPSVRGDLLVRLGRGAEARREFERAAAMASNDAERAFLLRRASALPTSVQTGPSLGEAVSAFLDRAELGSGTRRSYAQTLQRLSRTIGASAMLTVVDPAQVERAITTAFGQTAPKTWNRHRSALRSFAAWSGHDELASRVERRPEVSAPVVPIPAGSLTLLWARDLPARERAMWLLILESSAPVMAVLALDVLDLDVHAGRAQAGRHVVSFSPDGAAATVLPTVIAGRSRGPLFLTDRRPGPAAAGPATDRCPETGRQRLSYERAEYLFKRTTRAVDPTGHGYTLSQLRVSPP
jgi:RNA polymerase sigma factor (sigma-70 family)